MNRREFFKLSALAISITQGMPQFLAKAAALADDDKTLVVLQLSGGNDGLNTLVPFTNGAYYAARPNIAISKKDVIPVSADLGMHPSLLKFAKFFDDGQLAWIENVGYPNPNRSHFASMAIWNTADASGMGRDGWISKISEEIGDPFCATQLGGSPVLAMRNSNGSLPAIRSLEGFKLNISAGLEPAYNSILALSRTGEADFIKKSNQQMIANTQWLSQQISGYSPAVKYPESKIAKRLEESASLIATGENQRVIYLTQGGFDTHADQRNNQDRLLLEIAEALAAFQEDLRLQGLDDKVMVLAFSEFGRRVAENASGGTDHGQGSVMFALGKNVKGGIYGDSPDLENLSQGDIKYKQDFRGVYASALDNWLKISSTEVLGQNFDGPSYI